MIRCKRHNVTHIYCMSKYIYQPHLCSVFTDTWYAVRAVMKWIGNKRSRGHTTVTSEKGMLGKKWLLCTDLPFCRLHFELHFLTEHWVCMKTICVTAFLIIALKYMYILPNLVLKEGTYLCCNVAFVSWAWRTKQKYL